MVVQQCACLPQIRAGHASFTAPLCAYELQQHSGCCVAMALVYERSHGCGQLQHSGGASGDGLCWKNNRPSYRLASKTFESVYLCAPDQKKLVTMHQSTVFGGFRSRASACLASFHHCELSQ